jgi:catechol 2,3-dioxygenase-like lactoylglutathione lyase family enzyme
MQRQEAHLAMTIELSARPVFFVEDTPRAMAYYTDHLGFELDWTHEENGRPYVVQVSLLGLQIILNQKESEDDGRAGHGRIFIGLDDVQSVAILQHVKSHDIPATYTEWGAPTLAIHDLDRNEIYIWLSDAERVKWQKAHAGAG